MKDLFQLVTERTIGLRIFQYLRPANWDEIFIITPYLSDVEIIEKGKISYILKRLTTRTSICLITHPAHTKTQKKLLRELVKIGIEVRVNPRVHAKLVLLSSSEKRGVAIVGSANLTFGGLSRNLELAIVTDQKRITQELYIFVRIIRLRSRLFNV